MKIMKVDSWNLGVAVCCPSANSQRSKGDTHMDCLAEGNVNNLFTPGGGLLQTQSARKCSIKDGNNAQHVPDTPCMACISSS